MASPNGPKPSLADLFGIISPPPSPHSSASSSSISSPRPTLRRQQLQLAAYTSAIVRPIRGAGDGAHRGGDGDGSRYGDARSAAQELDRKKKSSGDGGATEVAGSAGDAGRVHIVQDHGRSTIYCVDDDADDHLQGDDTASYYAMTGRSPSWNHRIIIGSAHPPHDDDDHHHHHHHHHHRSSNDLGKIDQRLLLPDAMAIRSTKDKQERRTVKFRDSIHYMPAMPDQQADEDSEGAIDGTDDDDGATAASKYHDGSADQGPISAKKSRSSSTSGLNPSKSWEEEMRDMLQELSGEASSSPPWQQQEEEEEGSSSSSKMKQKKKKEEEKAKQNMEYVYEAQDEDEEDGAGRRRKGGGGAIAGLLSRGIGLMREKMGRKQFYSQELQGVDAGKAWKKKSEPMYFSQELGLAKKKKKKKKKTWETTGRNYFSQELGRGGDKWPSLMSASRMSPSLMSAPSPSLMSAPLMSPSRMSAPLMSPSRMSAPSLSLMSAPSPSSMASVPSGAPTNTPPLLTRRGGGRRESRRRRTRVVVEEGMIGLGWDAGGTIPVMLTAGTYEFPDIPASSSGESADHNHHHHHHHRGAADIGGGSRRMPVPPPGGFYLEKTVREDEATVIAHGNLRRVRIPDGGGHVGVAWPGAGRPPVLLPPGSVSLFSCSGPGPFRVATATDEMLARNEFALGPFRVVSVAPHEIGVKFVGRQPHVLKPGRHYLSMLKLEVFAGFESLLKRTSVIRAVPATSKDDLQVVADLCIEWQVSEEDAAFARLAGVAEIEAAVCDKARRAFRLAMWDAGAEELADDSLQDPLALPTSAGTVSSRVSRECLELFDEGWTITLWDLRLSNVVVSPKAQPMYT